MISIIVVFPGINTFASMQNDVFNVEITIKERNGIDVKDFLFRRGIAVEKGKLYDADSICIKENGNVITSAAEVTDRYDDGSISWLLISGKVDLSPNELKTLFVTNGESEKSATTYREDADKLIVSSPKIEMTMSEAGIESLKYNGIEKLGSPINIYTTIDGKTDYMSVDEMSVLKHTKSYSKFKLSGKINEKVYGEMYITLPENASEIEIEHRINVRDDMGIYSMGITVGTDYSGAGEGTIINLDFLSADNMQLASYDNTRFNWAASSATATGFIIGENRIDFAPIINGKDCRLDDGITRTAHLSVGFLNDAKNKAETLALPPHIKVDNEQYVRAGLIKTTTTGALFDKIIDSVKYSYERTNGRFNVGALAANPNRTTENVGSFSSVAGEAEYNLGIGWMQCQDEEVYRHMADCAEMRSDIGVYRGKNEECFGVIRTRPTMGQSQSYHSHAYYSDEAGLYMAYLLTGNEWVYESYKLCIEKNLEDMYSQQALSGHMPVYWFWNKADAQMPSKADYSEVRGLIRARTMYLAAELFEDKRYEDAVYEMITWAEDAQRPDGSFSQAVYNDGRIFYQGSQKQEPIKDYILLYGFRGVSEILEWTDDDRILELTCRVADYLCSQCENFGPILMNPNSNKEVYDVNESGHRGSSGMTNAIAVDVLCTAFEKTGSERYLKVMLEFLEAYLCNEIEGLGPGGQMEEGNAIENRHPYGELVRSSTLLKASDNITEVLRENREKIEKMGFENVLLVFDENAKRGKEAEVINYNFPAVVNNVYELGEDKAIFAVNNFAETNDGDWEKTVQLLVKENRLWQGVKNVVKDASEVTLEKFLKQYEQITAMQRPILVEEFKGEAEIFVDEYSKEKISVSISGDFEARLRIKSGKFVIDENKNYSVTAEKNGDMTLLTVTEGGDIRANSGTLNVKLNSDGKLIDMSSKPSYSYNISKLSSGEGLVPFSEILFYEDFASERWHNVTIDADSINSEKIKAGQAEFKTALVKGNRNNASAALDKGLTVDETGYLKFKHTYKRGVHFYNSDVTSAGYFTGKYVTEFKFRQDDYCRMDTLFRASAVDSDGKPYKHPQLQLDTEGNLYYYDISVHKIAKIQKNEWNTVKLILDVDNEKYDIYLNGILIKKDALFGGNNEISGVAPKEWEEGEKKRIDRFFDIEYGFNAEGNDAERGITYYDDIKIYREPVGRITVWANDLKDYQQNVFYEESPVKNFAGLGNDFATAVPDALLNSQTDSIEFTKGGSLSVRGFSSTFDDNATMEFDFSVSSFPENEVQIFSMKERAGSTYGTSIFMKNSELYVVAPGNIKHILIPDVKVNQTYNIILHTDLSKEENGIKGTYDVYIDDVCKVSGMKVRDVNGNAASLPDVNRIINVAMSQKDEMTLSIKKLKLYKDMREEVMAEAALYVGSYTNENSISLPTTIPGFEDYRIEWESSDESVIDSSTGVVTKAFEEKIVTLTAKISDTDREYTLIRKVDAVIPEGDEINVLYTDGCVKASASETKASGKKMLLAVYNSKGELYDVKAITVMQKNSSINIPTSEFKKGGYIAKAFLWNMDNSFAPMCEAKKVSFNVK